jgi:hypothetical protein
MFAGSLQLMVVGRAKFGNEDEAETLRLCIPT